MFNCLDTRSGSLVVTLSKQWAKREDEMREMARGEVFCCAACKSPIWFKCGDIMRPHFAHRSDSKCPLNSNKSAEELEAQALIYQHLEQNCNQELAIDVLIEEEQHPIDILIGNEKSYQRAFFFFSRDRRNLHQLLQPAKSRNIPLQIIYT